jgi:hypothetical protein
MKHKSSFTGRALLGLSRSPFADSIGIVAIAEAIPELITHIFDILDLLVVRLTIFGLAALGTYRLFCHH